MMKKILTQTEFKTHVCYLRCARTVQLNLYETREKNIDYIWSYLEVQNILSQFSLSWGLDILQPVNQIIIQIKDNLYSNQLKGKACVSLFCVWMPCSSPNHLWIMKTFLLSSAWKYFVHFSEFNWAWSLCVFHVSFLS